ncbi:MAG TPA: hypothetical protein VJ865_09465 [Gemmatimonadaceae bacterium]|nr:hypothetical protein [Gemmatimonadaceae bacterium]
MSTHTNSDATSTRSREMDEPHYEGLDFGPVELRLAMREAYDAIIAFVATPSFRAFHEEMMGLAPAERPGFISSTLFDPAERMRRGIDLPEGILIQTSAFGDRRPTLFAVKKMMPVKYAVAWENMNLTFNNEFMDEDVSRSDENAWRPPLPVKLQNELLARGENLESVPTGLGIKFGIYDPGT